MVHAVNSGHPGGSLGCTEFMVSLYQNLMDRKEGFDMFQDLMERVKEEVVEILFKIQISTSSQVDAGWRFTSITPGSGVILKTWILGS